MITKLSHATIYCFDHDEAIDFYVNKLGFELRMDATMQPGFRWVTVGPKDQPGLEIILMKIQTSPFMDEATTDSLKDLVKKGAMGTGVFDTNDCQATYEELTGKGVEFISPPKTQEYGTEALFKDNAGNWFSLVQRPG